MQSQMFRLAWKKCFASCGPARATANKPKAIVEDPSDITETTVVVVEQPRATVEDPGDIT